MRSLAVLVVLVLAISGIGAHDVYLVLQGADGGSCLVRNPVAKKLVPWLLQLPGLDHEKFIAAMGSTSEAAFVCCMDRAGDGRIADGATREGR